MLQNRVIPVLLMNKNRLVKTTRFKDEKYVGDPINTLKIFNEKEVDEIVLLDIALHKTRQDPDYNFIETACSECFMPIAYGGGIRTIDQIRKIFNLGVEKVILNSVVHRNPAVVKQAVEEFGSQSITVAIDVKTNWRNKQRVYTEGGSLNSKKDPISAVNNAIELGAGEIIIQSIDREGTYQGYDLPLIKEVSSNVSVPVVALGGASNLSDFQNAIKKAGASAVAAGNFFIYQQPHNAVLITYPSQDSLAAILS